MYTYLSYVVAPHIRVNVGLSSSIGETSVLVMQTTFQVDSVVLYDVTNTAT